MSDHDVEGWWFAGISTVFTVITGLAAIDMALGNPTAINGVIVFGFVAALSWVLTITLVVGS